MRSILLVGFLLAAVAVSPTPQDETISWIQTYSYDQSSGELRRLYDLVRGASGNVDNVVKVHSLRPHTLEGHYTLYKSILHHPDNVLPAETLEALGVFTSMTNGCEYSTAHHFEGLRRLLADDPRAAAIREAFAADRPEDVYSGKELALLRYARKLTLSPATISKSDIDGLRDAGATDGEILEANQVISYFNYANRTLDGLGVTLVGDVLGTSPRTK